MCRSAWSKRWSRVLGRNAGARRGRFYPVLRCAGAFANSRTAILQDDLVLVTLPGDTPGQPVPFAEVLDQTLAMPEEGDTVRTAVARAARDMGRELKVAYEVRSIPAMKNLVSRGAAASILPYFSVIDEVRDGKLDARQIVSPSVRRTLSRLLASAQAIEERSRLDERDPLLAPNCHRCTRPARPSVIGLRNETCGLPQTNILTGRFPRL